MRCRIAVFAYLVGVTLAQDFVDLRPYNATAENMFHNSDFDNSGIFERAELDDVFKIYDVNHDGRVARHEYLHLISAPLYNFAEILFDDNYDRFPPEGDGFLDVQDYDAYYSTMDRNSDSLVTKDEFVEHWVHVLETHEHIHAPPQAPLTP